MGSFDSNYNELLYTYPFHYFSFDIQTEQATRKKRTNFGTTSLICVINGQYKDNCYLWDIFYSHIKTPAPAWGIG